MDGGEQVLENQRQKGKVVPANDREETREEEERGPSFILHSGGK